MLTSSLRRRLAGAALWCCFALAACRALTAQEGAGIPAAGSPDQEFAAILAAAEDGRPDALARYRALLDALPGDQTGVMPLDVPAGSEDTARRLAKAARLANEARFYARTALGNPDYDDSYYSQTLASLAKNGGVGDALDDQATASIIASRTEGAALRALREDVFEQLQNEGRRGSAKAGTRLAWSLLRVGLGMPAAQIDPGNFGFTDDTAHIALVHDGISVFINHEAADLGRRVRAEVGDYAFTAGWSILVQKPLWWMLAAARDMRAAGVDPRAHGEWTVMEAPGGVIALAAAPDDAGGERPRKAFFEGALRDVVMLPAPAGAADLNAPFLAAARALHEGIMGDDTIAQPLRQALHPILEGTYKPIDPRDYFDNDFCRRLIEADYLEAHIDPMPAERARELARYRETLAKLEAGFDRFAIELGDDRRLVAVARVDIHGDENDSGYDQDTGEALPPFEWRLEEKDSTSFHSPLPARYLYALSLVERYDGRHRVRPAGVPAASEVWHAVLGRIGSYRDGDAAAVGSEADWVEAILYDCRGRLDTTSGPLGWNFPFHVLQRDGQGDPVRLATLRGVVTSPDPAGIADAAERRAAEDEWLDHAAAVLRTPGELGLIFHHFFRYCSDSPLPELPNLIGSHYGLSDTHQTVYQSLERRWVGRLIGDCDDLAEFFQVLTARQGKLSHVMQVPAHAAAGFVERTDAGEYRFVVLQTGPVLQFVAPTLYKAVEDAYLSFDTEQGTTQMTSAAVPILLRFADEDTRTPFVLPARIFEDRDYAEAMIRVQGHWHLNVFSAGIATMEDMIRHDREPGNLKELASLYEQVGRYEDAAVLRREELANDQDDPASTLSTLLEIASLHIKNKDKEEARATLDEIEALLVDLRDGDADAFDRVLPFRFHWAILDARHGDPVRTWEMLRPEVEDMVAEGVRPPDHYLFPLVTVYENLARRHEREPGAETLSALWGMENVLDACFGVGYFRSDNSYNQIINKYYQLGNYAIAREGRREGLRLLAWDGPFPEGPRDHTQRRVAMSGTDWEWLRIVPGLYYVLALEMLDNDDNPDLYDPDGAAVLLRAVPRAVDKGRGLGSDVVGGDSVTKSELVLALLNRDLAAFEKTLGVVREKNYASLYDDAAVAFGNHCGLVPAEDFPAWIEAFHRNLPGKQHYFKAAYRALDKEFFDHAVLLGEATARYFPDEPLLAAEAEYLAKAAPGLREQRDRRVAGEAAEDTAPPEADGEADEAPAQELRDAG